MYVLHIYAKTAGTVERENKLVNIYSKNQNNIDQNWNAGNFTYYDYIHPQSGKDKKFTFYFYIC